MRAFFAAVTRNPLSLLGCAIVTASAVLILSLSFTELAGSPGNPYVGILAYLVLPGVFLIGLILIPVGVWRQRRRGDVDAGFPVIDLNVGRTRRIVLWFVGLTAANVVILATATYKGVHVMDSTEFCGSTCHTVMEPERVAHARSPHSRVSCVACHIGPGAGWFVKSKLSGAWQVVATTLELYPRPIPTPVHNLRPARETCEQCHWPTKFVGDRLRTFAHFGNDESNTQSFNVLVMRIGGRRGDSSDGIHWHVDPGVRIRYRSDPSRETVHEVELQRPDGSVSTFVRPGAEEDPGEPGEWRDMDCVDCHNRPTHVFRTPEQELDLALSDGRLDRGLPFVRRQGLRLLRAEYGSRADAEEAIRDGLQAYYAENYPEVEPQSVRTAADALIEIWAWNVFPSMRVEWGTYPEHVGHETSPGCFRCHDDELVDAEGRTISQDCSSCHAVLAIEEEDPEVLEQLSP